MLRATCNTMDCGLKITLLLFVISLVGCANRSPVSGGSDDEYTPYAEVDVLANGKSWWYSRVKVSKVDDDPPNWAMGTLLAAEVFSPILEEYRPNIKQ